MSKKSLLLGILCSSLLISYHVKAETDVSTTVNTTTTEVVTQGVNNVKVENPVTTVTSTMDIPSGDIPSGPYKAVEPTVIVDPKAEEPVEIIDVSTTTTTTQSEMPSETTVQVTQPSTSEVVSQPSVVTTVAYSNVVYSESVSEAQSTVVETTTSESEVNTVNSVEKKPVGTLVRLGVSDKSKPVGTLKYYTQQLPNTNSENKKIGVLSGVVLLMGLLVHGLYYFSKRIFS